MRYLSVNEIAKKWNVSERSVRNYCAHGRVSGAFLTGKTWNIPEKSRSVLIKSKKGLLHYWIFCGSRKQANIPVVFTIRHKLI